MKLTSSILLLSPPFEYEGVGSVLVASPFMPKLLGLDAWQPLLLMTGFPVLLGGEHYRPALLGES